MKHFDYYANLDDYSVEVVDYFDEEFVDRLYSLTESYYLSDRQKAINYSRERLSSALLVDLRFEFGFYLVKHKENVVACFGIDNFCNWGVISRYINISNTPFFIPFGHGVGFPFAANHLKGEIIGLCSTQNLDQKDIMNLINKRYARHIDCDNMFGQAARLTLKTRMLPHTVWYRQCEQDVFVYDNDVDPPFEIYDRSRILQKPRQLFSKKV
jgi:hypothetical protein